MVAAMSNSYIVTLSCYIVTLRELLVNRDNVRRRCVLVVHLLLGIPHHQSTVPDRETGRERERERERDRERGRERERARERERQRERARENVCVRERVVQRERK